MVKKRPAVALFGGSFDPPHRGHQAIVQHVAALEDIDRVIVMPAFLNPMKSASLASPKQRLAWCQKVCQGEKVLVSDLEIMQHRPVYTIETLEILQKDYAVKYLVIGSDNLAQIGQWQQFDKINREVIWLVFTRGEEAPDCHLLRDYRVLTLDIPVSSTRIRSGSSLAHLDHRILEEVQHIIKRKDKHEH